MLVRNIPAVTIRVAGKVLYTSALSGKHKLCPNPNPILKQALMKPANKATKIPLVKLKSFTAFSFLPHSDWQTSYFLHNR